MMSWMDLNGSEWIWMVDFSCMNWQNPWETQLHFRSWSLGSRGDFEKQKLLSERALEIQQLVTGDAQIATQWLHVATCWSNVGDWNMTLWLSHHMWGMSSSQLTNAMIFQRGRSTTNRCFVKMVPGWWQWEVPMAKAQGLGCQPSLYSPDLALLGEGQCGPGCLGTSRL